MVFGWAAAAESSIAVVAGRFSGRARGELLADLGRRSGFRLDHEFANAFNTFVGGLVALEIALSLEMGGLLPVAGA